MLSERSGASACDHRERLYSEDPTMSERLYVTAIIQAEEGKDLEFVKKELSLLCEKTRREEKDCYRFDCFQDKNEPKNFILHEEFKNKAALDFHFTMPHTKYYLSQNLTKVIQAYFVSPIRDADGSFPKTL